MKNISYSNAKKFKNEISKVFIDVRTKEEYEKSHVIGSINIPLDNILKLTPHIIKDKNTNMIVYCSVGVRSMAACQLLEQIGYTNVYNIYGGLKKQLKS